MSTTPRPCPFPPPSRHNIAIGEVFSLRGDYVVVFGLLDTKAQCYNDAGKARSIAFDKLTDNYNKLGFEESIVFQKRVGRLVKTTKSAAPKKDKTKPASKSAAKPAAKSSAKRAPKKMVNAPAPGPNPSLN
jgi:hypothetical protein